MPEQIANPSTNRRKTFSTTNRHCIASDVVRQRRRFLEILDSSVAPAEARLFGTIREQVLSGSDKGTRSRMFLMEQRTTRPRAVSLGKASKVCEPLASCCES